MNKLFHLSSRLTLISVTVLLTFQLVTQIYLAKIDSQTTDEAVHLTAGLTYLTHHDWRWNPEHPPLVKILAAMPVLLIKPHWSDTNNLWDKSENYFYDSWRENRAYAEQFMFASGNNADKILFWARMPMVVLTLMLGLVIFYLSSNIFGRLGGITSLAIYVLDPTIMAHGHLITTDIALSLGFLGTLWALWRWLKHRSWRNLILFACLLALTELVKFTAVILYPILLLVMVWHFWHHRLKRIEILTTLGQILIGILIVWATTIAAYGFDFNSAPKTASVSTEVINTLAPQYHYLIGSAKMQKIDKIYNKVRKFFIPREYFKGLIMVLVHAGGGHSSFFLGQVSNTGWWYYFPVLLIAKLPIATIGLIMLGILTIWQKRKINSLTMALAASGVIFLLFAINSKANLGVRHVLPVMIVFFVLAGAMANASIRIKLAAGFLLITLMISTWQVFPYPMAYTNSIFGGANNTYNIATDSNLDWGQDLHRIKTYVDKHKIKQPYIEYTWAGQEVLDYYGFDYRPILSADTVQNGILIIGASAYQSQEWQWLHSLTPVDRITPSVFVFNLDKR